MRSSVPRGRRPVIGARVEPLRASRLRSGFDPSPPWGGGPVSTVRPMSCAAAEIRVVSVGMDADLDSVTERSGSPGAAGGHRPRVRTQADVRRARPLVAVLIATSFVMIAARSKPGLSAHESGLLAAVALACLVIGLIVAVLSLNRLDAAHVGAVAVVGVCSVASLWLQPLGYVGLSGAAAAMVFVAARLRRRPVHLAALTGAMFVVLVAETSRQRPVSASVVLCFPVLVICILTVLFQRLRDAKEQAESLLAQVEANRHAQAEAAALAERQHLAREMHDVLAHSLSGLMLHLEGARMLAGSSPSDPRLPLAVDRAHELAKEGLTEARHAIGMLRDEQLPGPEALSTLTDQFTRHSGIPCSFAASGPPQVIRPDARLAVYRVTQEALTNVVKHAHADRVEVRIGYTVDHVGLTIEDFGPVRAGDEGGAAGEYEGTDFRSGTPNRHVGGYGLTGMRERAELLGGALDAEPTPTGFRVSLRVPV